MNSAIHIGNNFDEKSLDNVADAIKKIFEAGHVNHMDQATVQQALRTLEGLSHVTGATVQNCSFVNDTQSEEST